MPAYVLIDVDVTDPARYKEYLKLGDIAMAQAGGRFLARGGAITHLEGDWKPTRLVVIEFADEEAAKQWYASAAYQKAKAHRSGAARFSATIVAGLPN